MLTLPLAASQESPPLLDKHQVRPYHDAPALAMSGQGFFLKQWQI